MNYSNCEYSFGLDPDDHKYYLNGVLHNVTKKRIPRSDDSIQHFAIFFRKGMADKDTLVIGENKHSAKDEGKMFLSSIHAEIDALYKLKSKKNSKNNKYELMVVRISKTGKLGESRPCYHCLEKLENSGIKIHNVYYSTKNNIILKEKFNTMKYSDKTIYCSAYRQNMRKLDKPVGKFVYK
ncbi:hypothetical protein Catovirus_1_683 [Catovirus CTV1]|uniref:CMP/dCMP-type deaminase domain-containing protein n=1 Tax=Catovirus CTV1 TaxID=1977631 RepID=A0A1V0SAB4_9VIRU|nr:hypothetical protein Catovirus_1_683 [Catovirus CTV1]